jgi:tRNA pseudouridine55 synthase
MLFGVLNVFKPAEFTSRDVVNIVQRACPRKTKVGHAGTLDPMATGVLVVATGPATKLIQYAQNSKKSYVGAFRLGLQSDTEDVTGDVKELPGAPVITESQLRDSLPEFIGSVSQIPPQYSAVKVNGQRAYKAARRGELVEIKARPTTIYSIDLLSFEYPDFAIEIQCGKGTRTNARTRHRKKAWVGCDYDEIETHLDWPFFNRFGIEFGVDKPRQH